MKNYKQIGVHENDSPGHSRETTALDAYLQILPSEDDQGLNAEKATTELCPPNPNEFEMAAAKTIFKIKLLWVLLSLMELKSNMPRNIAGFGSV